MDAFDLSEALIEEGRRLEDIRHISNQMLGKINFAIGDMANISASLPPDAKYKLVTILGDSFLYLRTPQENQEALNQYFRVLEVGGKVVLQFRSGRRPTSQAEFEQWMQNQDTWCNKLGVSGQRLKAQKDGPGKLFPEGTDFYFYKDVKQGDGFYAYFDVQPVPPPEAVTIDRDPHNRITKMYDAQGHEIRAHYGRDGLLRAYYDRKWILHSAFGRVYVDADGNEKDLGIAEITNWHDLQAFPVLKDMLLQAGFRDVDLKEQPLSLDGSQFMFTVTAQKPELYSPEIANKILDRDIMNLGIHKPMGYLLLSTIAHCGKSIEEVQRDCQKRGLSVQIFESGECRLTTGGIYVYDQQALQALLDKHQNILLEANWPLSADEFVHKSATTPWVQSKTALFNLIADAFGDKTNPLRLVEDDEPNSQGKI